MVAQWRPVLRGPIILCDPTRLHFLGGMASQRGGGPLHKTTLSDPRQPKNH